MTIYVFIKIVLSVLSGLLISVSIYYFGFFLIKWKLYDDLIRKNKLLIDTKKVENNNKK